MPVLRTEAGRAAVSGVDMQPHIVPPTSVRDVHERIERPDRRRTRRGAHRDNWHTPCPQVHKDCIEPIDVHASLGVERHAD